MKKNWFVCAALIIIALASCSRNSGSQSQGGSGRTDIRVLNYFDLTSANSVGEVQTVWQAFEQNNPDIRVIREDPYNEPFHQKTEAYAATRNLPDVIYAWPSGRSSTLHTQRLLKDLTPLITKDNLAGYFLPAALDPKAQGGGYIAILPQALTSTHVLYVNLEVLRDAGLTPAKTYSELRAQVPVLRAKGYQTILMANQDDWVMQSCLFSLVAGRFGGEGWEQKILDGTAKFTDPEFVNALNFIKTMYDDGVLDRSTLTTNYGSVVGQFATNRGAYLIDGDWRIGAFITDQSTGQALIPPARQENIQLTVFPFIEGAKLNNSTSMVLGTGWGISASIPSGSAREDAAWRMVKWLLSKEVLTYRLETGGIATPARRDIDPSTLTLEPLQKAGSQLGSQYSVGTAVIDSVFHSDVFNPLNVGLQEIGMGARTPQQVAESVQRSFDNWKRMQ